MNNTNNPTRPDRDCDATCARRAHPFAECDCSRSGADASPRFIVDGATGQWDEAEMQADGEFPPFRVFDVHAQTYASRDCATRDEAQRVADAFNLAEDVPALVAAAREARDEIERVGFARGKANGARIAAQLSRALLPFDSGAVPRYSVAPSEYRPFRIFDARRGACVGPDMVTRLHAESVADVLNTHRNMAAVLADAVGAVLADVDAPGHTLRSIRPATFAGLRIARDAYAVAKERQP